MKTMDIEGNALTMWAIEDFLTDDLEYIVCDAWAARKLHNMYEGNFVKWHNSLLSVIMNSATGMGVYIHVRKDSYLLFCKTVDDEEVVLSKIENYSRSM